MYEIWDIQQGLPHNIEDIKRQTEDPHVLATVSITS